MAEKMIEVYDTRTNQKLPQRVPAGWLAIFDYLSETPKSKGRAAAPESDDKKSGTDKKKGA